MILRETEARKIIDLNPYGSIDKDIAERQFHAILTGFNYLIQDESDFLYIADEVGLGKTYIALGIASLLRHFADAEKRETYKDVVIVPKRNLQYKWIKEITNFINNNYLIKCNIVKSVLETPVGECNQDSIHHYLACFSADHPSYEIFRNTSFSIATSRDDNWKKNLLKRLPKEHQPIFKKGIKLFRKKDDEILLKRLYAYLLNLSLPYIDLLIVDEAHNFKHGIGDHVSNRNQVMSRLMGVVQDEDDESIFLHFPELKNNISSKAEKVIFLSATPIDNGLYELKQQLDVFLPKHQFIDSADIENDIKSNLSSFLIRGLMNIKLDDGKPISRNMYRHEHRRGNVIKQENAQPQYINDDLECAIVGLLQYNTLKHFNEKNNKSFEIGMLAGFETFNVHENYEKEYEETSAHNIKKSEDQDIIKNIAESYFEEFGAHLPHPKQDNLIKVLMEGLKIGNKSLVFVRRIASVIELERKLTHEVEDWQYQKIKTYIARSKELTQLENAFLERHDILEIESLIDRIISRVFEEYEFDGLLLEDFDVSKVNQYLLNLYYSEEENESLVEYRQQLKNHKGLIRIKKSLKDLVYKLLDKLGKEIISKDQEEEEDQQSSEPKEDPINYFFNNYFSSKRYIEGFNFRKRASTKDWYRFNIFYLKDFIDLHFDSTQLVDLRFTDKDKTETRRMYIVNDILMENKIKIEKVSDFSYSGINPYFKRKTFFNLLCENLLKEAFQDWVNRMQANQLKGFDFYDNLDALFGIFRGIFRNGSGLLPAYVAESIGREKFEKNLIHILEKSFPEIIMELKQILNDFEKIIITNFPDRDRIQRVLYGQMPVAGASGFHKRDISRLATQFRMPGYPYVLITTDVLKEGEDLHLYCSDVYHYGMAWNPSDMEQRTGRIDRINSCCYFRLKKEGKCTFDNSLQVFYPYLADTLEVNQVAKVFHKMNDFVQTFYDVSVTREKESTVSTDEIVKEIPVQIKDFLSSKYDYQHFKGLLPGNHEELSHIVGVGLTEKDIDKVMKRLLELVTNEFPNFILAPHLKENNLVLTANINLNGRRAPLRISLVKGEQFNQINFSVESIICRSSELRELSIREEIRSFLNNQSLELYESNDFLLVQDIMKLNQPDNIQVQSITKVLQFADDLENQYTNGDLDEDL